MTVELEDRLRMMYADRTAEMSPAGPGLSQISIRPASELPSRTSMRLRIGIVLGAAAAIAVPAIVAVTRDSDRTDTATAPPVETATEIPTETTGPQLTPAETLPDAPDDQVPITVATSGPTDWYRIAPDLEIAWFSDESDAPSQFCWHTPVDQQCVDDVGIVPVRLLPTAGGQTLVLLWGDAAVPLTMVTFDDGNSVTLPVEVDDQISVGVARLLVPDGRTIVLGPPPSIPGSTLEPDTTADAVQTIPLLAIGESVMVGAATTLTDHGMVVDAAESRGTNKVLELVQASVQGNGVQTLVIQIGTNGPVSQSEYDAIAQAASGVPRVVFMTVKAPLGYVDANNAIIRSLPTSYPNVQTIDWAIVGLTIQDQLSESDGGVHLNSRQAVDFYANLILAAAGFPLID